MTELMTLLDPSDDHSQPVSAKERAFKEYWKKVERAEKNLATAQRKRQRIMDRFNAEVLPLEHRKNALRYQIAERLMDLCEKKQYSKRQRSLFFEVCEETMESITQTAFRGDLDISSLYKRAGDIKRKYFADDYAADQDMVADKIKELFGEDNPQAEEFVEAMFDGFDTPPENFEDMLKEMFRRMHGIDMDEDGEHEASGDNGWRDVGGDGPVEAEGAEIDTPEVSKDGIHKLYRRLAQRFHPDRASNDAEREARHVVMLQLTQAKRDNDVYRLLQVAMAHGQALKIDFSDDLLDKVIMQLAEKLRQLRAEKRDLKGNHSLEAVVYQVFHSRTNREMDERFVEAVSDLHEEIEEVEAEFKDLRSAKGIKRWLAIQQEHMDMHDLFGHEADFLRMMF